MNVTLCSAFRNASGYLERYHSQVWELTLALRNRGDRLYCIWAEGDHTDKTWGMLHSYAIGKDVEILSVNHNGPDFGSVIRPQRFAQLAGVWNAIWQRIPQDADAVLVVESDLIWQPETLLALLDDLGHVAAVSPMIELEREGFPKGYFYDRWAARKDGKNIGGMPPYFPGWNMKELIQVDSMGSCMAIRGDLARQLHWPEEDVFVGLSRLIYELGGSIWLDPTVSVRHL